MSMNGKCLECGKPVKDHLFCLSCYRELSQVGEIVKCENCNEYRYVYMPCANCGFDPKQGKCAECGAPAEKKFCYPCFKKLRDSGKIVECEKCGEWYKVRDGHKCVRAVEKPEAVKKAPQSESTDNDRVQTVPRAELEALIESEKDSGMDVRKKWPAKIRCEDGHYVRSHAECRIDDWLKFHNIPHEYETLVYLKATPEKKLLCDFYIPDADLYIEYWGYKDKDTYLKRKAEKTELYKKSKLKVLDLDESHLEILGDAMKHELLPLLPENLVDNAIRK